MMLDRFLAVGGGLIGGVLAMVTIWLAYRLHLARIDRAARMGTGWSPRVHGGKILAQNANAGDRGVGT